MEIIEQIRQVASIVEIVSQYTTLRKRGRKHVGLCPFHTEKTPSFTVDEEKQLFHCFGCGVGGDVFSLIMEKENLDFPEAVRFLAEKYHIPIPRQNADPKTLKLEEKLFKINEMALAFFRRNLHHSQEGRTALRYLQTRKLGEETVQALKIGYALNSWDALLSHFKEKGVSAALLENAGLVLPGKKKGEYYDRFRGRVIFPIFSLTGKIVAFGGRTITGADPKYLNSPDTPLYSKGKLLYGLNLSKDAIREEGETILVEGYTDYAALYQAGIRNVVASLGTALTPFQVGQAVRFAGRMIVNYDGDSAGRNAAARAVPLCFEKALSVKILLLPEDLDPDAYIAKYGLDRYLALAKKSISGLKFLVGMYSRNAKMDIPEEKARVIRAVVKEIDKVPDSIVRSENLREAATLLDIDEIEIRDIADQRTARNSEEEKESLSPAEKRLLQILFENRDGSRKILEGIHEGDFSGLRSESLFKYILGCFKEGRDWSFFGLKEAVGSPLLDNLSRSLQEKTPQGTMQEAQDCLKALRKLVKQNRLKEIQIEIAHSEKLGEKEKLLALLYLKQDITKQILAE